MSSEVFVKGDDAETEVKEEVAVVETLVEVDAAIVAIEVVVVEGVEETSVVVEIVIVETLVDGDKAAVDIAVEGIGGKMMSDVLVEVVEVVFVRVVEVVLGIVCVVVVEAADEDKESIGAGVKGASVECVSDMQKDSNPPASKQNVVSGNFSGLT